jgi:large subunit ribosomal protein L6
MKHDILEAVADCPDGIEVSLKDKIVTVKSKRGEISRSFVNPKVSVKIDGKNVVFWAEKATKREKKLMNSFRAHVLNMFRGIANGHTYKLKVCSGHFPVTVSVQGKDLTVKNFLGERFPRKLKIKDNVTVKVEGDMITVDSNYKELAGQTAADIEQLTKVRGRDLRIFQDGIWIIHKDGKDIK